MDQTHTPLPWNWSTEDGSLLTLQGTGEELEHVLSSQRCKACHARGNHCLQPLQADMDFILLAVNSYYEREAELTRLRALAESASDLMQTIYYCPRSPAELKDASRDLRSRIWKEKKIRAKWDESEDESAASAPSLAASSEGGETP